MISLEAGHALQFGRDATEMQGGFFRDGILGDNFPIELNGVIHHAGKFPNDNVQVGDAFGVRSFRVSQGEFQEGFSDG
jgi:hypothetical protein